MNGPMKYNPRIDSLRQIGAIKLISPKTHSITRHELKNWIKDFTKFSKRINLSKEMTL
jgi:hypothetical protein